MAQYRKKPVVIEAFQWGTDELPDWARDALRANKLVGTSTNFQIETLEGTMVGDVGDWVVKGVQNELYPCKPDIFEATYEAVDQ
jgi:hypothetical protein